MKHHFQLSTYGDSEGRSMVTIGVVWCDAKDLHKFLFGYADRATYGEIWVKRLNVKSEPLDVSGDKVIVHFSDKWSSAFYQELTMNLLEERFEISKNGTYTIHYPDSKEVEKNKRKRIATDILKKLSPEQIEALKENL
jgi:hypothetical protein